MNSLFMVDTFSFIDVKDVDDRQIDSIKHPIITDPYPVNFLFSVFNPHHLRRIRVFS